MSIQNNFPAIKPTLLLDFANVQQLDPRITFSRASTATYYGTQTAKAEENLLQYSQEFDNAAWVKTNITVTANTTTAPDGTTTADRFTASAGNTEKFASSSVFSATSGQRFVFSCWAKKDTHDFVQIAVSNQAATFANFDLATGVTGTSGGVVSSAIVEQPAGSGFYRISIVFDASSTIPLAVFLCLVGSSSATRRQAFNAAGTETVDFWGAQAEIRSTVTAYTPTTTQPITNYIPVLETAAAGVARFDHNPITGESLGLEIEEQRTNIALRSEEFDNAYWSKDNLTTSSNQNIAPDGTLTSDLIISNGVNATHDLFRNGLNSSGSSTLSVYAKKASARYIYFALNNIGNSDYSSVVFDLETGTAGTVVNAGNYTGGQATIVAVGNGWYRVSLSASHTTANDFVFIGIANALNPSRSTRGRISSTVTGELFIWGAQLEAGAFPTSYIPTTTAQVTRSADAASMTGANFSSWYRQDEGTLYGDFVCNGLLAAGNAIFFVSDGTNNNRIGLYASTTSIAGGFVNAANTTQANMTATLAQSSPGKAVIGYKVNDFAFSLNGATPVADTAGQLPIVNTAGIGSISGASIPLNGTIKKIAYYPLRLTNAEIVALTAS
jgi:hypothetical protein